MKYLTYKSGCSAKCIEEFNYLMKLTGWSEDTVLIAFFVVIFMVLIIGVLLFDMFRKRHHSKK